MSKLKTAISQLLQPLPADVRAEYPTDSFNIASTLPTITIGIKEAKIYNKFAEVEENTPRAMEVTVKIGIYVRKSQDSAQAYELFNSAAELMLNSTELYAQEISCTELEYIPDLRHYRLSVTAVFKFQEEVWQL